MQWIKSVVSLFSVLRQKVSFIYTTDAIFLDKKITERAKHKAMVGLLRQFPSTQYGQRNQNACAACFWI